ncbi:hypothetical protein PWT90_03092 [Aphanocladium album]|nr:hypothetical protein PWT90_03092 [Aphanocladium album]
MNLFELPNEILLEVASSVRNVSDISNLSRANRRLHEVLDDFLYKYDAILRHRLSYHDDEEECCWEECLEGRSEALAWAAWNVNFEVAAKAIRAGADCNIEVDRYNDTMEEFDLEWNPTPMALAVASRSVEMARYIFQSGGRINPEGEGSGDAPIFVALGTRSLGMVKFLCGLDEFDGNVKDCHERGILAAAAHHHSSDAVHYLLSLLDLQADKFSFKTEGALHIACYWGNEEIVRHLLNSKHLDIYWERDTPYESIDPEQTPFSVACQGGHLKIAELLLHYDKEIGDIPSWCDMFPINYAMVERRVEIVEFLMKKAPGLVEAVVHDVFDFAVQEKNHTIAKLCIELVEELDEDLEEIWSKGARSCRWRDLQKLIDERYKEYVKTPSS